MKDIQQKICENAAAEYAWWVASKRLKGHQTDHSSFPADLACFSIGSVTTVDPFLPMSLLFSGYPAYPTFGSITKDWHRNKGSKSRTIISDQLSSTLNDLQNELEVSDLYENVQSRKHVLARAIPRTLVDKVGLDTLMQRLPEQVSRFSKGL